MPQVTLRHDGHPHAGLWQAPENGDTLVFTFAGFPKTPNVIFGLTGLNYSGAHGQHGESRVDVVDGTLSPSGCELRATVTGNLAIRGVSWTVFPER
jgi:hypothetical protein